MVDKEIFRKILFLLKESKINVWLLTGKIFSHFFVILFTWLIIDRFSPNYLPIGLILNEFGYFIVDIIFNTSDYKDMKWDSYFRIFLYVVSIVGVIIHNEIVVINVCNLGSDTKYFLNLELEQEELYSNTDNPEILKRYETLIELESEDEKTVD